MKKVLAVTLLVGSMNANSELPQQPTNNVIEVFNCTTVTVYREDDNGIVETSLTKIIAGQERLEVHYNGVRYSVQDLDRSGAWAYGETTLYSITYSSDAKKGYLHLDGKSVMFDTSKNTCFKG